MTYTYNDDIKTHPPTGVAEAGFTPVYARKTGGRKAVKTWMILAPVGVLALAAGAATMLMNPKDATPFAEPAVPTSSLGTSARIAAPATPAEAAPLVIEDAVIEPASAPARTVRQPAPAARRAAPAPTSTPRVETPPQPAGPQPYTGNLNTAPTTTPAPTPTTPPPVVVIEPQG